LCVAIGVVIGNIPILGLAVMREGIGSTVVVLREAILHAGFAWCLIAPLATLLLYGFLSPMFKKAAAARTSA
jgi:energy-converting hydrogenase Eha subunit H